MAMTDIVIKVTPEVLASEAELVSKKTKAIQSYFDAIKGAVNRSNSYWRGDAADAHRKNYAEYADEISGVITRFRENADSLSKMAQNYTQAEAAVKTEAEGLPVDVIF